MISKNERILTEEDEKKLQTASIVMVVVTGIPLVFMMIAGIESRGWLLGVGLTVAAILFGFFFSRIISKFVEKYCKTRGIDLMKKPADLLAYNPGRVPTMIIKFARVINMICGVVAMWFLSKFFGFDFVFMSAVAGFLMFASIQGKDITMETEKKTEEESANKKDKK